MCDMTLFPFYVAFTPWCVIGTILLPRIFLEILLLTSNREYSSVRRLNNIVYVKTCRLFLFGFSWHKWQCVLGHTVYILSLFPFVGRANLHLKCPTSMHTVRDLRPSVGTVPASKLHVFVTKFLCLSMILKHIGWRNGWRDIAKYLGIPNVKYPH